VNAASFPGGAGKVLRIVSIGAHPDDVEEGMGGTLAKHARSGDEVHTIICTLGGVVGDPTERKQEALRAASILGIKKVHFLDYSVFKLNNKINLEFVEIIKNTLLNINPERVYVHSPFDNHQVHRCISNCVVKATNDLGIKQLVFYEVVSSTNYDFKPDAFVDIGDLIDLKIASMSEHKSQSGKIYMQPSVTKSVANMRYVWGMVGSDPSGMAEAFKVQKILF
jgi:LmbE family N-acetylglucosaminyl deacetylase